MVPYATKTNYKSVKCYLKFFIFLQNVFFEKLQITFHRFIVGFGTIKRMLYRRLRTICYRLLTTIEARHLRIKNVYESIRLTSNQNLLFKKTQISEIWKI